MKCIRCGALCTTNAFTGREADWNFADSSRNNGLHALAVLNIKVLRTHLELEDTISGCSELKQQKYMDTCVDQSLRDLLIATFSTPKSTKLTESLLLVLTS